MMKYISLIAFVFSIFLSGCDNTVGNLDLKGKVLDENTKVAVCDRTIIVEAVFDRNGESKYIDNFSTDSKGCFEYTLRKIKNVSLYNFKVEGDSVYAFSDNYIGLSELNTDSRFLSFYMTRLTDFTIIINRISKTPLRDTLFLTWKTNGIDGRTMYPYKIENYRINSDKGLAWVGGDVKSLIKTKVFADKNTLVRWELLRNGQKKVITDTIFCLRNVANRATLNY